MSAIEAPTGATAHVTRKDSDPEFEQMTNTSNRCPKCSDEMQQGFVADVSTSAHLVSHWYPGPPLKSFWSGTKGPGSHPEQLVPIGTFRCKSCGYLESYARTEFEAK